MRVLQWRRPRLAYSCCRYWRIALPLALVVLLLLTPVRNALLKAYLPGLWLPHNTIFLVMMALDSQQFPVDETPVGSSPVRIRADPAEIESVFLPHSPTFQEYNQHLSRLRRDTRDSDDGSQALQQELDQMLLFKPNMTPRERATALFTMDVFIKACKAANLTYFLIGGSLMGSMRHHGMIPWDDDFDVMMNGSEWRKIRDVLSNVEGFELFAPSNVQWKFYLKSLPKGNKPFKWPNMDIFFYKENKDYIYSLTMGAKQSMCNKKSDIFPLVKRKFDFWDLFVPRHSESLLTAEFGDFHSECATPGYVHKSGNIGTKTQKFLNCKALHKYFPFVFHNKSKNLNSVLEMKMVNGKAISNVTYSLYG